MVAGLQFAGISPATAAPLSDCTPTSGTIVAVDFAHWARNRVVVGCGVSEPTGLDLLHAAGFTTSGDQHDGDALVCRIGDVAFNGGTQYPTVKEDPCVYTPPGNAYWSYWLANSGSNSWSFSPKGAVSEATAPGQVQAWEFGAGNPPGFSPASVRPATGGGSPSTTARTSAAHTTATSTHPANGIPPPAAAGGVAASAARASSGTSGATSSGSASRSAKSGTSTTTPGSTSSAAAGTGAGTAAVVPSIVAAHSSDKSHSGAGSIVGIVVLSILLLGLGGAGVWLQYRRAHPAE
jgi:hypothetical protein